MKNVFLKCVGIAAMVVLGGSCARAAVKQPQVRVMDLRVEQLTNPMGIDAETPRLSWKIESNQQQVMQTTYRLLVASSPEVLAENKGDLWDSDLVSTDLSQWVPYQGKALKSNQRCYWKVQVGTNVGTTPWSEPAQWSMGLLTETHWQGRWVGYEGLLPGETTERIAARYLRKEFTLHKPIRQATLHICGLGLYEAYINGQKVGEQVLAPAPTDYRRTVLYNTFDVTSLLQAQNAMGVVLGAGRYFPMRQNKPYKVPVFGFPKMRLNLIVEFTDGSRQVLSSDESWKLTADGPIRWNNEFDGECFDATRRIEGWTQPNYSDTAWLQAQRSAIPTGTLRAMMTPYMKVKEQVKPVALWPKGKGYILDLGQNMTGWIRAQVQGASGDTLRFRYAERLNADSTLYVQNLRSAKSTDSYICNGREQGTSWTPTFVTHGFRYVEVTGMASPTVDAFVGEMVYDDLPTTGRFECSNQVLDQIYRNAWWGIAGNYKGIPVDCPQRDERQPWLGDRARGSLGESYLFGNEPFYVKWMNDIREAQREDGCIPDVAPAYYHYYTDNVTWPSAFAFGCDMLYTQYGNSRPIVENYPALKKWMLHLKKEYVGTDGLLKRDKYGDWCLPPESEKLIHSNDPARKTDGTLLATAYYVKMLQLMERFAGLQGLETDRMQWAEWRQVMTDAFNARFLTVRQGTSPMHQHILYPDSVFYGNNTITANLLPLAFDMVPAAYVKDVEGNLMNTILTTNKGLVGCGVIGVQWLLTELSRRGRADVAYLLATNTAYPSWGYMAQKGATTIWELWNGDTANPAMNSGNHVMLLGDLLTWCYRNLGGIACGEQPDETGYKRIVLSPNFDIPNVEWVNTSYETPYGKVASSWKKNRMELTWQVEVPCNTTAELHFPDGTTELIGSGQYSFTKKLPQCSPAIVESSFLYEQASFPECHSASIVETSKGDLVATFFGGTKERNPDVCIWVCRQSKGKKQWTAPMQVADGVWSPEISSAFKEVDEQQGIRRKACWNPVLFQIPKGDLLLFYKIGSSVRDWTGWVIRSKDGGKSWSRPKALPEGFLGPIKNKPIVVENRMLCPSSTEDKGWRLHFEISDDWGETWRKVGPLPADLELQTQYLAANGHPADSSHIEPILAIQPAILTLPDGTLQALARTRNGKMATTYSKDGGESWSQVTLLDALPNNNSGIDAVTLADGRHWVIYNNFGTISGTPKGLRNPLDIAQSIDGQTWQHILCLEESPISQYSYPSLIQGKDGMIHAVYTWRRQRVGYMKIDPAYFLDK